MRAFIPLFALATVTLVLLLSLHPLSTARALAIWILLVTASVLYSLVRGRRDDSPPPKSRFEAALRRPKEVATGQEQLVRLERELALGVASAGHASRRLLPRLRAVAIARLFSGYGIELERRPDAARALLGDDAWELLRPDRPKPENPREPGVPRRRVVAVIERLEAL
jgi:hypothetical protein